MADFTFTVFFFRIDEHGNQVAKGFSWNHCIYENNKKKCIKHFNKVDCSV
jgi:hypothetical protein